MKKLRPSGGYRDTASFQTATIIYDATVWFCEQFLDPRSRTVDQMVQAAPLRTAEHRRRQPRLRCFFTDRTTPRQCSPR
jgi:hypothetical protein